MVRLSKDDLLAAWKALDRSQIDEQPGAQGWREFGFYAPGL